MVERNGLDYAAYLTSVFHDDEDFKGAAMNWAVEEVQHGDALGRWAMLADPEWDYNESFERYRAGYRINVDANVSIRGSRTGELIARCMVETGTSSFYSAVADATHEPVLRQICHQIASDEFRHYKLFYDHMRRYVAREKLNFFQRLRIAAGRITETEDEELAFAYHCANQSKSHPFVAEKCLAAYLSRAIGFYRYRHLERGVGMMFKAIGLPPRGRLSEVAAWAAWRLMRRRQRHLAGVAA